MSPQNTTVSSPSGLNELAERLRRSPASEVGGREEAERELRELRRLEARRADEEPAPRAVDRRAEHEHRGAEDERCEQQGWREIAESVVVEARRDRHERDSDQRVDRLPLEEAHRIAVADGGRRRCRAVHHHEPERDEPERDECDEALVAVPVALHASAPNELAEGIAACLEVAELVEARARRREQDDVSGCCGLRGRGECLFERAGADARNTGGGE